MNTLRCETFFLALTFVLFYSSASSQSKDLYTFQQLSEVYYAKQSDSLKKAWACPVIYKDKATQKEYKDMWDSRTDFIIGSIKNSNFIHEDDIYNYVSQIINEIASANRDRIPQNPLLFIDRSSSVNAYSIGGNIIAVDLGLILFSQSREELAFVIAHELSHNILKHTDNAMKERAEWITSDEYKNSLNSILDSKYERLTRLKKIVEKYSFNRSKHNRYHESDADSLGIILLKNSKIPFDARLFLHLDSADIVYQQPLADPVKNYFTPFNLSFEDAWTQKRSKGLSTRNYNFKDTTGIDDSLKTHPDCVERYNKTKIFSTPDGKKTPIPTAIKEKADKMVIWNMFDNMDLTPCLYRIFQEKDNGNKDEWYDFMIYNIFSGLYYSDKQLNRFNAVGVIPKEYISKDYYQLQTMLEQMPRDSLQQYCKQLGNANFWKAMPSDAKAVRSFFNTLNFDDGATDKTKTEAAKQFSDDNSTSMYCEFTNYFKKK